MPVTVRFDPNINSVQAQIIPNVSLQNDGVMSKDLFAKLTQTIAVDNVALYVDSTNGNDANPGALSAPLLTFNRALEVAPAIYMDNMQIILLPSAVPYTYTGLSKGGAEKWPQPHGPNAAWPMVIGDFTNEVGTVVVTLASNGEVVTSAGLALIPDQYRGAWVKCISGNNVGQARSIISNTATALSVQIPFDNPILVTDQFIIQKNAVTLKLDGLAFIANTRVLFYGVKLDLQPAGGFQATGSFSFGIWDAVQCELALNGGQARIFLHSSFEGGVAPPPYGNTNLLNPLTFENFLAGNYIHDGGISIEGGSFAPVLVGDNLSIGFNTTAVDLSSCSCRNSEVIQGAASQLSIFGADNGFVVVPATFDGSAGGDTITCSQGGFLQADLVDVSNSAGNAFEVNTRGIGGIIGVSGTGNAGFGINVQQQAGAFYASAAAPFPTSVTGAGGDTQIAGTVKTYAQLDAGPGYTDPVALVRIEPVV